MPMMPRLWFGDPPVVDAKATGATDTWRWTRDVDGSVHMTVVDAAGHERPMTEDERAAWYLATGLRGLEEST